MSHRLLVALALGLATAGCLSPRADPSTFYVVTANAAPGPADRTFDATLGIGPVTIPGYLDRSELVRRVGGNQLAVSEVERWAEPLGEGVLRVVRANLVRALRPDAHVAYPWYASSGVTHAIEVDVHRFEADARGTVVLQAEWRIRDGAGGRTLAASDFATERPAEAAGTERSVAAMSDALEALCAEIASALRGLRGGRG